MMTANKSFQVRTPNTVENTGLDSATFPTREEAERALALAVLASGRDISERELTLCGVVEVAGSANTTFQAWNEKSW